MTDADRKLLSDLAVEIEGMALTTTQYSTLHVLERARERLSQLIGYTD
jgi:hypothetical protein